MKKITFSLLLCLLTFCMQAQYIFIYSNDQCDVIEASSLDAIFPNENNELHLQMMNGEIKTVNYESVDSISVFDKTLEITTLDAIDVERNSATLKGSIDWVIPVTVGFLVSENSSPNFNNSINVVSDYAHNFSSKVTGLDMNKKYYCRAYACFADQYYYGNVKYFNTCGYKVGDAYPNDVNPIGVVFEVSNNGSHGKIVSLEDAYLQWDSSDLFFQDTGGYNWDDGSSNPMIYSKSPLQKWIVDELGDGWYCPAVNELLKLGTVIDDVNSTIEDLGYDPLRGFYWSSTQNDSSTAYFVTVTDEISYMGYANGWYAFITKDGYDLVLGVKKF